MSYEILSDAAFSNLFITGSLFVNDKKVIDSNGNGKFFTIDAVNGNITHLEQTLGSHKGFATKNTKDFIAPFPSFENYEENQTEYDDFNEVIGNGSTCVGGNGNHINGDNSVILGGVDNQCVGQNAISGGKNALALHDNTLVYNNTDETVASTKESQVIIGSKMGMFFMLPMSSSVKECDIQEGFACWCWDSVNNVICLKTRQNDKMYRGDMTTYRDEIQLKFKNGKLDFIIPDNK